MAKTVQNFQTETKELLDLMVHSLYSHREIFLRELISNASDAIEKLKFESLTNPALGVSAHPFEIRLESDPEKKTLKITDNGIGMTREEVIQNIGTIAHSGTRNFIEMRKELKENPELIGQFGVGFYSSFMVADRVSLHTRKAGTTEGVYWESEGSGSYSIEEMPREEFGTTITLHLKDLSEKEQAQDHSLDHDELVQDFTDPHVLRQIIKKYSDFVAYPIKMKVSREETKDGKTETIIEDETFNSQKALWLRSPSEITAQEYNEFYRHLSHDWVEPLKTIHYKAEGIMEFVSILYVPAQKPFDYDFRDRKVGLSLYVKRVFIKSDCEELIQPYLRFVKGMVDSDDLSLNVSREILQQDRQIGRIKKALTNKILSALKEILDSERSQYEKFWSNFGVTLKEGIAIDPANSEKLQDLLLFHSSASDQWVTLKEYFTRMQPGQKAIYYITGDNLAQVQNSPYLEKLKAKGFEVLLMTDRVDAWVATNLSQYDSKPLQSIMSENLDLSVSEDEKKAEQEKLKEAESKLKPVMDLMKDVLKEQVQEVKLSDRLTESPVCLVASSHAASAHMERLLESLGQAIPKSKRILEINPNHPVYEKMLSAPSEHQREWIEILYQQALLNEGSPIENPMQFTKKIANLMMAASY